MAIQNVSNITDNNDDIRITARERESANIGTLVKTVDEAITIAKAFALSGMFPDAKNAGQALAKILMGAEFGISPAAAMNSIHYVQGKLQMSGVMIGTLIRRNKTRGGRDYDYRITEHSDTKCTIEFYEGRGPNKELLGVETFTDKDAIRQGTGADSSTGAKGTMKKYPKNMLYNRAMSNGAKFHCPEIFGGASVYTEGEIIEAEVTEDKPDTPRSQSIKDRIQARVEGKTVEPEPERDELTIHLQELGLTEDEQKDYHQACQAKGVDPELGLQYTDKDALWAGIEPRETLDV